MSSKKVKNSCIFKMISQEKNSKKTSDANEKLVCDRIKSQRWFFLKIMQNEVR